SSSPARSRASSRRGALPSSAPSRRSGTSSTMYLLDIDHWQEIADTLRRNRLRTLLTAFGVFWGIFLLIVMQGAGNGLRNGTNVRFAGYATNSVFIWTQSTSKPYRGL